MCKEDTSIILAGILVVDENRKENAKGHYRIMRKGKTRKDKDNGSWVAHLANKAQKALENKAFHRK